MNKKLLIFGGFGFIGTNLIEELLARAKYELLIFESENVIIQNPDLIDQVKIYHGDFHKERDYEIIFKENEIDLVIHLIGTTVPSNSNDNMIFDINSNLINTIKLLEIMKKYSVKDLVFLSSGGTVYGIQKDIHKETDPTDPICSYGIVKLTIEKYLYLFKRLHGLNYLILRPSNAYGEYQKNNKQGLINVVLRKLLDNENIEIWGDGSVIRDYIYVKDLVKIITDLIENNIMNEIFNVGSCKGYSINDILKIMKENIKDFQVNYVEARKVDVPYVTLDINKLKSIINMKLTPIQEGILKTYKWLVGNQR